MMKSKYIYIYIIVIAFPANNMLHMHFSRSPFCTHAIKQLTMHRLLLFLNTLIDRKESNCPELVRRNMATGMTNQLSLKVLLAVIVPAARPATISKCSNAHLAFK